MIEIVARPVSLSTLKRNNRSLKRALRKDNWTTLILDVNAKRNGRTE